MEQTGSLQFYVFRVEEGLGNAILLRLPDGSFGVIDWGTEKEEPLSRLLGTVNGSRVSFIVATHPHADHTLGIASLMKRCRNEKIPIDRFFYSASTLHKRDAPLTRARFQAKEDGIGMVNIQVNADPTPEGPRSPPWLAWGDTWEVRVLAPAAADVANAELAALKRKQVTGNETSLVILFRFKGSPNPLGFGRALFPGDATPAVLEAARATAVAFEDLKLDNQAFVVPHHGSQHNLPAWIVERIHGLAMISTPTGSLHHPHEKTLKSLATRTCASAPARLFCTSYAGACAKVHGGKAAPQDSQLIAPGPCFEHIVVELTKDAPATLVGVSSPTGHKRRVFGYCGEYLPISTVG